MSAKPSFSVGRALAAAAASLPAAWGGAWLAMILVWAGHTFGSPFALSMNANIGREGQVTGAAVVHWSSLGFVVLYLAVMLILTLVAMGAVYRAILFGKTANKEGLGFGGLQFGLPELRLLASDILTGAFILVILAALVIVFAVAFATVGGGHGYANIFEAICALFHRHQGSDWVFIVYLVGALVFLIFLKLKFVLRHAATIAERRIVSLNALGLSSGNVGKLFIGLICILVPFCVLAGAVMHLAPHSRIHAFLHPGHGVFGPGLWLHATVHAVLIGVAGPLLAGFLSSAYRQIIDLRAK